MKLILLALIQSMLLCAGQLFMKLALKAMGAVSWSWAFVWSQVTNWWWLACGISFTAAGILWMYILKHWSFSQAYPLSSLAYVFGMHIVAHRFAGSGFRANEASSVDE